MADTFDTPVDSGGEKVSVASTPPSFDDLPGEAEAKTQQQDHNEKIQKQAGEKEAPNSTGEVEKGSGKKEKEPKQEKEPQQEKKPAKDADASGEVSEDKPRLTKEQIDRITKAKKIEFLDGEEKISVTKGAHVPVKVSGELKNVTLQELVENYSGKVAWDKKFTELTKERDGYDADKQTFMTTLEEMGSLIKEGKAVEGVGRLLDLVGGDIYNFKKVLMTQLMPEMEEYLGMSDEERASKEKHDENEALRSKLQKLETSTQEEKSRRELQSKIESVQNHYKVTEDQFVEASKTLQDAVSQNLNGLTKENLTPEFVCEYALARESVLRIEKVANEVNPRLFDNAEVHGALVDIVTQERLKGSPLTDAELSHLVKGTLEDGLSKDAEILNDKTTEKVAAKAEGNVKKSDKPELFDDYLQD